MDKKQFFAAALVLAGLLIAGNLFAVEPQKKHLGNVLLESGASSENIMPLLTKIAGRQRAYFKRVYAEYNRGYLSVKIDSAGKIDNPSQLEAVGDRVIDDIIRAYPLAEGKLEMIAAPAEPWNTLVIMFEKGKITRKNISPNDNEIERIKSFLDESSGTKFGLSEERRKKFFTDRNEMIKRISREGYLKFPNHPDKRTDYEDQLYDQYSEQLRQKYGITKEEDLKIREEGNYKGW